GSPAQVVARLVFDMIRRSVITRKCSGGRRGRCAVVVSRSSRVPPYSSETPCLRWQQPSPQQVQVRQSEGREQPRGVLRQAAVAHLAEAPQPFDYVEDVLASSPGSRAQPIDAALILSQWCATSRTAVDAVADALGQGALPMRLVPVGLITEDLALLAVKELGHLSAVVRVRGGSAEAVYDAASVGTHVSLHPEMPVFPLLRLVHLRVSRSLGILGGGRSGNDRRIHNRAGLQQQSLLLQELADLRKDALAELVLLEQMPKAQDRRLVRNRILGELDTGKAAHRLRVVQRVLHRRVREVDPVLHEVDTQHPFQRHRLGAVAGLRIMRLDQPDQALPRNHRVHFGQKALPTGHLTLMAPRQRLKARLLHRFSLNSAAAAHCTQYRSCSVTCAEIP